MIMDHSIHGARSSFVYHLNNPHFLFSKNNCLGFDHSFDCQMPTLVAPFSLNQKVIDAACGENFTIILSFDRNHKIYSSHCFESFKIANFQNIKEKIKTFRHYSIAMRESKTIENKKNMGQYVKEFEANKHEILNQEIIRFSKNDEQDSPSNIPSLKKLNRSQSMHNQNQSIIVYDHVANFILSKSIKDEFAQK